MINTRLIALVSFMGAIALATAAAPGPEGGFDLSWNTTDGGGGASSNGGFELEGTIGQPDAAQLIMTGGSFELQGGFWSGVAGEPSETCAPDIVPPVGLVNVDDLLAVINSWGACDNPSNCPADIAPPGGDDLVNVDDLLAVINAWGICD